MVSALKTVWKSWLALCLAGWLALPANAQSLLVVGDSISAAFGLELEQGWVSLLQERLHQHGYPYEVINASVSGDTTAGGLARLPSLLERYQPALVMIELGGNDGLRGLPPANMQQNLSSMVRSVQSSGADALLLGIRIPPNYGVRYTRAFEQVFVDVSQAHEVPLVPFVLEGVAGEDSLMQADGIHPTAAAQPIILDNTWPAIEQWLQSRSEDIE
ncbi:arylesterase [Pseudomonas jilinensis]|uniref:Arylesterase n=1 Tax=Pseudomonas jilinensis TaxID=2078689 RepID=A0A396S717_9PSED|nr:arylesterase [Pseudomonas jilinensis]